MKEQAENRVKEYREKMGLSQRQLSIKSGVSRSRISEIETNAGEHTPTVVTALKLAKALETTVDAIFWLPE